MLDKSSYYWIAVDACFQTLAEEGSRKDEVAKKSAATPFRKGRFTFASLVWYIGGAELRRPPTRAELLTLRSRRRRSLEARHLEERPVRHLLCGDPIVPCLP